MQTIINFPLVSECLITLFCLKVKSWMFFEVFFNVEIVVLYSVEVLQRLRYVMCMFLGAAYIISASFKEVRILSGLMGISSLFLSLNLLTPLKMLSIQI